MHVQKNSSIEDWVTMGKDWNEELAQFARFSYIVKCKYHNI